MRFIDEAFVADQVPDAVMDQLWAAGWRHFGIQFFRYNVMLEGAEPRLVTPLRIDLQRFAPSKSQRRVLRRNADLQVVFEPAAVAAEDLEMFDRHKQRFRANVPAGLTSFVSENPASVPCRCLQQRVYLQNRLVAAGYLDVGRHATSAVYGFFAPEHSRRSLGIFTILQEIEHSRALGCRYYYLGYATREPSVYDYKKQFGGLEEWDWMAGEWLPCSGPASRRCD